MRTQDLQLHIQLKSTVQNLLNEVMIQNKISATDMVEAIEHYLLEMREAASLEYVQWAMQEKNKLETKYETQLQEMKSDLPSVGEEQTQTEFIVEED